VTRFRASLGALDEPQFRLLFFGRSFSVVGSSLVPVALAFAVFELGGSATDLGLILAIRALPTVLLLLVGGVWADRLPRNVVMLASDVVQFAVQAAVAVLLLTDRAELWHLAVAAVVTGSAHGFFNPASTAIVPSTVSAARLQQANALLGMTTSGIGVLGPAVSGGLVAAVGPGWAFAVDSVTYLISAGFLLRMHVSRAVPKAEGPNFLAELRDGFREWRARTWLVAIDAWVSVFNMTVTASFVVLGPLVADEELNGASSWGLILGSWALGLFAGDGIAVVAKPRRPLVLACASLFPYLLLLVLLAAPATTPVIAFGAFFAGAGLALHNTLHVTTIQEQVPDVALSRVDAYDWVASIVFTPIGYAIVGPLAAAAGTAEVLVTFAVVQLVLGLAVLSLPAVRKVERRGAPPVVPALAPVATSPDLVAPEDQARQ
jgi:MFS family permease